MVLAFATLILQLSVVPQTAIQPVSTGAAPGSGGNETSALTSPATTSASGATSSAASTPDADTHGAKSAVDPTPAFRNVRLGADPAPAGSETPATKDIALEVDQTGRGLSTIRVPEIKGTESHKIEEAEIPSRRKWLALALTEHAAATFDAYSTRQAVSRGAVEDDPIMRPFAHSDAMYAAVQVGPLVFDYLARRMQRSDNLTMRRFWWLPQSLSTGVSLFAGVHNLHVASNQTQ